MRKVKLWLLTLLMAVGGVSYVSAQKDVTSQYITNATLSSLNGWTNVNFNTPVQGNNTKGYASECYAGWGSLEKTNYSLTQKITLPAGKYTLVNYSFFRYGLAYNTDASKSLAFLKAGNSQVAIKTLGSITATGYANNQAEGANAFDSKMYRNTLDFTIDADNTEIEIGLVGTFDLKQSWIIAGMFELIDNGQAATMDSPFDVTGYITNPGFEYRDMTGWTVTPSGFFGTQDNNQGFKVGGYYAEKWQASGALPAGSMSQTISDLPAGYYKLTANLGGNGTYIDLNGKRVSWTADKDYTTGYVLSEGENLTITAGKTAEGTANWIHFDNFKLYFCGDVQAALTTLIGKLSSYESKLPTNVYSTLRTDVLAYDKSYSDVDELLDAINAVQALYDAANTKSEIYLGIKDLISTYAAKAATLDAAGQAAYDATAIVNENNTNGYENISAAETLLIAAFATATKAQTTVGSDWTGVIINPSFESDLSNGWTNNGLARQSNTSFGKTGTYYAEKWEPNGTFGVSQTIAAMPAGIYRITARAKARSVTSARIYAAGIDKAIAIEDSENDYSIEFMCDANANITIGFEGIGTGEAASWLCVDNFTMSVVSVGLPDVEPVAGKMNADVATAQTTAVTTYNANRTVANYNAAIAAIAAAQASKDAYEHLGAAITKIDAALAAATTATVTDDEAYQTIKTAYNNGTIENADIQANINNAYDAVIAIIKSQTATSADFTMAIKNQSFEYGDMTGWTATVSSDTGVRETSNATYAATGTDGYYLFNTYWQGVPLTQAVTGLPNGQYTLTASVSSDGATIYLIANGEHNDGIETGGEYPSKDVMQETTITFLVKDGTATIGVVGGADGTAGEHKDYVAEGYWWYKADNFRLVKNRDLTPEEAAVVPTAIALKNGDDVVTEVTLNATANTVTLTPSYTPANASEGYISWTTSNPEVATVVDGVVTGVLPGTATITATSTLAPAVSSSVTVNVTYPESDVPETYYVNNNATRTVYTLGENLIKNGSFEYPTSLYGWTASNDYTTAALASNFTITETGGVNDGKYITGNGVGAAEAKSLTKLIAVEAGKTYYFSVYTSGKAPNNTNQNYNALFKLKSDKKEDGTITKFNWPQGADKTTSEWSKTAYIFTADDSHPYVGIRLSWAASANFDEFVLAEVVSETTEGNVDYAKAAIPAANIGNGVFQYSQEAINATGANELVQGISTAEEVQTAYDALQNIELNAPADGQLFNVILTYAGWTYDQKAMTYIANGRSDGGKYNIQYKEAANKNLAQAFTFTKVEKNNYKMSQIDADGVARYISTGVPYSGNTSQIRTVTDAESALVVTVIPTGTEGVWNLKNTEANQFIGSQDAGVYTVNNHINFSIVETTKPAIAINTTAAGWGTVMLPFAQALPDGVKAYSCAATAGDRLTLTEVYALEANKPYLVEGAWDDTVTGDAQGIELTYTDGLFTGVYANQSAPVGSYVLQKNNDALGFYKVAEGKQPTVKANRAYLTVPASARVAFFFGEEGETTSISALQSLSDGNVEIYNTNGVRIPSLQKGMNILKMSDGKIKKVMVK